MPGPLDAYRKTAAMQPVADLGVVAGESHGGVVGGGGARPWIGVQFVCTGKYVRVFRRGDGSGYLARCPTCGKTMWFRVGQGGTGDRFFEVSCR